MTFSEYEKALESNAPWLGAWRNRRDAYERAVEDVARLGWLYVSRFVRTLHPSTSADLLAQLGGSDLAHLRAVRFLNSKEVEALLRAGPELLRRLPQSTRSNRSVEREVKGRVDWPGTFKERLALGGDSTVFKVSRADRHFDVSENRALAYALTKISETATTLGKASESSELGLQAERLLANSALSSVIRTPHLGGRDRQALRQSRLREFREIVEKVLELHDGLFSDDLSVLKRSLGERIWLPPEADKVFELWTLFAIVEGLETAGWQTVSLSLIRAGNAGTPTFVLAKDGVNLDIGYQSLPDAFLRTSKYRTLLAHYQISGSSRRPDILITAHTPTGTRYLLVEVKLTDNRDYITESIYKLFGYLSDFQTSFSPTVEPHGILVVWSGIPNSIGPPPSPRPLIILTADAVKSGHVGTYVDELCQMEAESAGHSAAILAPDGL